jgi:hypothetical protein
MEFPHMSRTRLSPAARRAILNDALDAFIAADRAVAPLPTAWTVGSWRDDAEPADEIDADRIGVKVSDSLTIYPPFARAMAKAAALDHEYGYPDYEG